MVYSCGSLYTSIIPTLLLVGVFIVLTATAITIALQVGECLAGLNCHKILLLNGNLLIQSATHMFRACYSELIS